MVSAAVRRLAAVGALAALLLSVEACELLKCGPGTREQNGKCVALPWVDGDGSIHCGGNTILRGSECIPIEEICGPFTEVVVERDDAGTPTGYFQCVGTPPTSEGDPPPCPDEFGPQGEICINGFAHWVFDPAGGQGAFMENRIADSAATEDSTFAIVEVYDPLAYANDPEHTQPLGVGEINPREGTFRVLNVAVPSQGILALVVEDIDNDASDLFALTGVPYPAVKNENLEHVVAFGVTHDQVTQWSEEIGEEALQATGCPEPDGGGPRTLLTCGTWISRYVVIEGQDISGVLGWVEGVIPEDPAGDLPPQFTFYPGMGANGQLVFDDPTQGVVWSDDLGPHEWTGILGSVFGVYVQLGEMSGHCETGTQCDDVDCIWIEILGGSIPDALFVQFMPQVRCSNWPTEEAQ